MINEIKVSVIISWNIIYAQVFSFLNIYLFFLDCLSIISLKMFSLLICKFKLFILKREWFY